MLEFLIDNIFAIYGGRVFQQTIGIPMGTNGAPLLADLFLYSHEADFIQRLLKKNERKLARSLNFTFRYIDDLLSLNNYMFDDFIDHIYPTDSEGRIRTKLYDKRDDFNFPIVNFPFICSNIPTVPAYGVYISQLIRYSRSCDSYQDVLDRGLLLTRNLLN
jgi:hypothetical protein